MAKKSMKKKGGACAGGCWSAGKRRTRRFRGGMYGFQGGVITNGTLESSAAYSGPVNSSGAAVPDPTDPAGGYTGVGGRRRKGTRKGRKGSKKSRKGTRKMRGGAGQMSAGTAGYGYAGTGAGGLADATGYTTQGNAF
jgi:hypothetical protein